MRKALTNIRLATAGLIAAIGAAGCGGTEPPTSTQQPVAKERAADENTLSEPPSYEIAFVYSKGSDQWQAIVVDRDVDLSALARHLHAKLPTVRFQIFDTMQGVEAYVNWTKNYPNDHISVSGGLGKAASLSDDQSYGFP